MALSATMLITISGIGSQQAAYITKSGSGVKDVEESIAGPTTNGLVAFTCDITAAKMFYMWSDVALTVKTNSSSVPQETIALGAGVPVIWIPGEPGQTSPFAGDVTALYVTNATAETATLRIKLLEDVTP